MNRFVLALFWALSLISVKASALSMPVEPPIPILPMPELPAKTAVKVSFGSIGGAIDNAAIRTVRKVVGHAIASGTVDIFVVTSPANNGLIPIEGGLSFCAEVGVNIFEFEFNEFIDELKSIQPNQGTFYNINLVDSCPVTIENDDSGEDIFCIQDAKICPDGSGVGRVPPSCEFAPCPIEDQLIDNTVCTEDAKICPDGTGIGRVPPNCEFAQCPREDWPRIKH